MSPITDYIGNSALFPILGQWAFFNHAGVSPLLQLEEQQTEDMLWIRQEFLYNAHQIGATVVFGHTPMRGVMFDLPYKLGIDTGLVYGGKLTCVELNHGAIYQVERRSRQVRARPASFK